MDIFSLLYAAKSRNASDLHLLVGSPPLARVNGALSPLNGLLPLNTHDVSQALVQITTSEEREEFYRHLELDFGYTLSDGTRLRCNAAQQRGGISLAVRLLPPKVPTIDELELPEMCKKFILQRGGLVIISGPTGSGKTTTQAAMIQHLNTTRISHVVTIEDPIEYLHSSLNSAVTQRQLGSDTLSFANALKHILRQDPDVILVGEMRDLDTAAAVITLAETGHLVLATGHAPYAHQAVERMIDLFPPHERHLAETRLASLLSAVLCQTLVPRADGSGRIAAVEIMLANPQVRNLIREGKIHLLPSVIRTHRQAGMISLDEALVDLYLKQIIAGETLFTYCRDSDEVEKLLNRVEIKQALLFIETSGERDYERVANSPPYTVN